MIIINKYISEMGILAPLAQAAIWGGSSLLASKLANDKNFKNKLTPEEKARQRKIAITSSLAGGLAGAAGSLIDAHIKKR